MILLMEQLDLILHVEEHLQSLISMLWIWAYVFLFSIIFAETGLVITPFLPGDSLLFIVGTLAGAGYLNIWVIYVTLLAAAIIGDSVNYWLGSKLGPKV